MKTIEEIIDGFPKADFLYKSVTINNRNALFYSALGAIFMISSATLAALCVNADYFCSCAPLLYAKIAIALLMVIAGLISVSIAKICNNMADKYRDELIVQRDIYLSIRIASDIPDTNKTETMIKEDNEEKKATLTQKAKMQEQIIEAILNRCSK